MSLLEGDIVFFTAELPMERMLASLLGVSGAASSHPPRLCIADADDPNTLSHAIANAKESGASLILYGENAAASAPPGCAALCLPRPFLLSDMTDAVAALCGEHTPDTPLPPKPDTNTLRWDAATRTLCCGDSSVRLSGRAATVFAKLYEASPDPVPDAEMAKLFPGTQGNGVAVYISRLRRILATLSAPAALTYLSGRGYALLLPSHKENERLFGI